MSSTSQVYPDPVRVVSVGVAVDELLAEPSKASHAATSTEFCGGTHVAATGEAQSFVLLQVNLSSLVSWGWSLVVAGCVLPGECFPSGD
jgi:alanyl-tRNA synthetase